MENKNTVTVDAQQPKKSGVAKFLKEKLLPTEKLKFHK